MVFVTKNGKVVAIIADILGSCFFKKTFFIYLFLRQLIIIAVSKLEVDRLNCSE